VPRATVVTEPVHKDLKNAPPDGFVLLRPLPYGQALRRRDMASRMTLEASRRNNGDDNKMVIDTFQRVSKKYEFEHCIVDHNLEDERGQKLNFAADETLDRLDPRIGEEIERYLAELNEDQTSSTTTTVDSQGQVVEAPATEVFDQPSA
jgi:hypothetical protein